MFKLLTPKFSKLKFSTKIFKNVTPEIESKIGKNIYLKENHPLSTIKVIVQEYFKQVDSNYKFYDNLHPKVTTKQCFDDLLIPKDHVSRKPTDTYFYSEDFCLRTHTTAHQTQFLNQGEKAFLICGDVYRRDEVDSSHYPVFHQMDGVRVYSEEEYKKERSKDESFEQFVERKLKEHLDGLVSFFNSFSRL